MALELVAAGRFGSPIRIAVWSPRIDVFGIVLTGTQATVELRRMDMERLCRLSFAQPVTALCFSQDPLYLYVVSGNVLHMVDIESGLTVTAMLCDGSIDLIASATVDDLELTALSIRVRFTFMAVSMSSSRGWICRRARLRCR